MKGGRTRCATLLLTAGIAAALLAPSLCAAGEHDLLTASFTQFVKDGMVEYEGICQDPRFAGYILQLSSTDPSKIEGKRAELAFWLNAYNAFGVRMICDNYPVDNINDLHTGGPIIAPLIGRTAWDKRFFSINGEPMNLKDLERKVLRSEVRDPRVHFALSCPAVSCPPLRAEAYEADRLDAQFNDQARVFMSRKDLNTIDLDRKIVKLSSVFQWHLLDFGKDERALLQYLAQFAPKDVAESWGREPKAWRTRWKKRDWTVNELKQ